MNAAQVVEHCTTARHMNGCLVPTVLRFDPADPFQVVAEFTDEDGSVPWRFPRWLLVAGQECPVAAADVEVQPHIWSLLAVTLRGEDSTVQLFVPRRDVRRFLDDAAGLLLSTVDLSARVDALLGGLS